MADRARNVAEQWVELQLSLPLSLDEAGSGGARHSWHGKRTTVLIAGIGGVAVALAVAVLVWVARCKKSRHHEDSAAGRSSPSTCSCLWTNKLYRRGRGSQTAVVSFADF